LTLNAIKDLAKLQAKHFISLQYEGIDVTNAVAIVSETWSKIISDLATKPVDITVTPAKLTKPTQLTDLIP